MTFTRSAIAALLAMFCGMAQAQQLCRTYEYLELKEMKQEKLVDFWCDYQSVMTSTIKIARSQRDLSDANHCSLEMERIERVLDLRFNAPKPANCPAPKR